VAAPLALRPTRSPDLRHGPVQGHLQLADPVQVEAVAAGQVQRAAVAIHAAPLAATADESVYAYAHGVMAEVIRELANLAEREMNRGA
jgi:hypothetical protein